MNDKRVIDKLLRDLQRWFQEKKINIDGQFQNADYNRTGQIGFYQFRDILKGTSVNLSSQENDLLLQAFGDSRQNIIYYQQFSETLNQRPQTGDRSVSFSDKNSYFDPQRIDSYLK